MAHSTQQTRAGWLLLLLAMAVLSWTWHVTQAFIIAPPTTTDSSGASKTFKQLCEVYYDCAAEWPKNCPDLCRQHIFDRGPMLG